jgi:hypothetical protein
MFSFRTSAATGAFSGTGTAVAHEGLRCPVSLPGLSSMEISVGDWPSKARVVEEGESKPGVVIEVGNPARARDAGEGTDQGSNSSVLAMATR